MIGALFSRLTGKNGTPADETPSDRVARLDSAIRRAVETITTLNARHEQFKEQLSVVVRAIPQATLDAVCNGNTEDTARLHELEQERARLESEINRTTVAAGAAGQQLASLRHDHEIATHDVLKDSLNRKAAALEALGEEVEPAMAHAADLLTRFRDLDLECSRLAYALNLSEGRACDQRMLDALSKHFASVLLPWTTGFQLDVTRAARGVDFRMAATRPFTPSKKENPDAEI